MLTLKETSEILGVSTATIRNWYRLGKIKGHMISSCLCFDKSQVKELKNNLKSLGMLKKRRNKSLLDSNFIPKSYISNRSPNFKTISALIKALEDSTIPMNAILGHYCALFLKEAGIPSDIAKELCKVFDAPDKEEALFLSKYSLVLTDLEDTLGFLYLSLRAMTDKKATGAYYTPFYVVDKMITSTFGKDKKSYESLSICDPACGTGNFLLRLPEGIKLENINGFDIDETAIAIARINISIRKRISYMDQLSIIQSNIVRADYLHLSDSAPKFDVIIGNPPWGYSYTKKEAEEFKKSYDCFYGSSRPESFSLFIERAIKGLTSSGKLIFLLPETILETKAHQGIRDIILKSGSIASLFYLGEVFSKVQCPCVILEIGPKNSKSGIHVEFLKRHGDKLKLIRGFDVSSSRDLSQSFHILADDTEQQILDRMDNCSHFTLKDNSKFALGIVTGSNEGVLVKKDTPGSEEVIKGIDVERFCVLSPSTYIVYDRNKLQQVAPDELYRAPYKLFYRFISDKPVFALDTKGRLSLNSANILIPEVKGYDIYYILGILNSSMMEFYYSHKFRSVKVLRSAIESLPIPACSKVQMEEISAISKKLVASYDNHELYKLLNDRVSDLYSD